MVFEDYVLMSAMKGNRLLFQLVIFSLTFDRMSSLLINFEFLIFIHSFSLPSVSESVVQ